MPAILKLIIATAVFAIVGFAYDMMTSGGHTVGWLVMGAIFGFICYPLFRELRETRG